MSLSQKSVESPMTRSHDLRGQTRASVRYLIAPYTPPSGILLIGFWVIADNNLCGKHKFTMLAVQWPWQPLWQPLLWRVNTLLFKHGVFTDLFYVVKQSMNFSEEWVGHRSCFRDRTKNLFVKHTDFETRELGVQKPQGFSKFTGKVKRHAFVFEPSFEKVLIAIIHMQLLPSKESKPTSFHNKYMFSQVLKINIYRSSDSLVIWLCLQLLTCWAGVQNSNNKTQKASVSHRGSDWMMLVTALSPGDVMAVRRMRRSENSNSGLSQCSASPLCVDQRGWRRWERAWGSVFGGQPFILS